LGKSFETQKGLYHTP